MSTAIALTWLLTLTLGIIALFLSLPTIADVTAFFASIIRKSTKATQHHHTIQRFLFLVPAHDEELLIERCVRSLLDQEYPTESFSVYVIADNCTDETAAVSRDLGARVLERSAPALRGKHHAIDWALSQVELARYDAVVIIDADASVNRGYSLALNRWPEIRGRALHTYDSMTNEFENWLTRLAGLLTRNRYDIGLPAKVGAGLSCPLTGDGMVLGTGVLTEHGWNIQTITEGWELYARLTLEGVVIEFEPLAVFYDQEARSLGQSAAQRERWASGRVEVLRLYAARILTQRGVGLLQRLDLLAELTSFGPVLRTVGASLGLLAALLFAPRWSPLIVALFAASILHPIVYSLVSLARHPQRTRTMAAFLHLPRYAAWRLFLALRSAVTPKSGQWVRTARHQEDQ